MKKAMICQPMNGIKEKDILDTRERAMTWLHENGYEVVDTYFSNNGFSDIVGENDRKNNEIYYLGKSLEKMSLCDTVYFCDGWRNARGCQVEHFTAKSYGLHVIYDSWNGDDSDSDSWNGDDGGSDSWDGDDGGSDNSDGDDDSGLSCQPVLLFRSDRSEIQN